MADLSIDKLALTAAAISRTYRLDKNFVGRRESVRGKFLSANVLFVSAGKNFPRTDSRRPTNFCRADLSGQFVGRQIGQCEQHVHDTFRNEMKLNRCHFTSCFFLFDDYVADCSEFL